MKLVLFDMDGTLTPPRGKIQHEMLEPLIELQQSGYRVGIISGSDIDYITEQCNLLFGVNSYDFENSLWLPCNGTKQYTFEKSGNCSVVYDHDLKSEIGKEKYNRLISILLDSQIAIKYSLGTRDMPLSGTFIQYRGSTINWCPIGRDATVEERNAWVTMDKRHNIRARMLERLRSFPVFEDLVVKLGGETSFDIFPKGWDKSYVLKNFGDHDAVWFIGDRCGENGNDKELFDAIALRINGESFETTGPSKTIDIIRNKILNQSGSNKR